MVKTSSPLWPTGPRTVFFNDVASRTTLSNAVSAGRIQRIAPGRFSADTTSPPEEIVADKWPAITGHLLPGATIVDRSAAASAETGTGVLFVAADTTKTRIRLPGLMIRVRQGATMSGDSTWSHGLFIASPERTLLDNLEVSRSRAGNVSRTLTRAELENWLAGKAIAWGPERTDRLRVNARNLAIKTDRGHHVQTIDTLFEQLTGLEPPRPDAGRLFAALTRGGAWDQRRLDLFSTAAQALSEPIVPAWLPAVDPLGELPFYESYFSNYIEGTEFTLEEARTIVDSQEPPADRPADGHDILGTYRCVVDPIGRAATSTDPDELITHLRARHREIMRGRPDKRPGEWKTKNNQVGTYQFVEPDLVDGTLRKGLEPIERLPAGLARAPLRHARSKRNPPVHRWQRTRRSSHDERRTLHGRRSPNRYPKRLPRRIPLWPPTSIQQRRPRSIHTDNDTRLALDRSHALVQPGRCPRTTPRDQRAARFNRRPNNGQKT